MNKKIILLLLVILFQNSCKNQTLKSDSNIVSRFADNQGHIKNKYIKFGKVSVFTEKKNIFSCKNIQLIPKTENSYKLTLNNLLINEIDLESTHYEGPGFNIYLFESSENKDYRIIIFDAEADIGTAWCYFLVLKNNKLIDEFFLKDPRPKEAIPIQDFFKIALKNGQILSFTFDKNKIAKYTVLPKNCTQENNYIYFERRIYNKESVSKLISYNEILSQHPSNYVLLNGMKFETDENLVLIFADENEFENNNNRILYLYDKINKEYQLRIKSETIIPCLKCAGGTGSSDSFSKFKLTNNSLSFDKHIVLGDSMFVYSFIFNKINENFYLNSYIKTSSSLYNDESEKKEIDLSTKISLDKFNISNY